MGCWIKWMKPRTLSPSRRVCSGSTTPRSRGRTTAITKQKFKMIKNSTSNTHIVVVVFHRDNQVWKYGGGVVMLVGFSNGYEGANTVAWEDRRAFFHQDYKEFKDSDDQVMGEKRRCQITRGDILRFSHETYHGVEDLLAGERKLLNIEVFPDYRFRKPILNYWGVDGVEDYNFFGAEWVDERFDELHGLPYEVLGESINQIRERVHERAKELKTPKPAKVTIPGGGDEKPDNEVESPSRDPASPAAAGATKGI